jgi:E1A/CREB-binding protein
MLLFMRHCAQCMDSEQCCVLHEECTFGKKLWEHMLYCREAPCTVRLCSKTRALLRHHQACQVW